MDEFEFFFEKPWSDGLPVVIPTEARIVAMLAGARRDPGETLGPVPPAMEEASVRAVAAHAVMAGCKPEYLPVLLGALEAMLEERFNLTLVQATTSAGAPLLLVNGPCARRIGLHGGTGCLGPGFRANATIGRAVRLILLNLGGGVPGVTALSGFGGPWRYTFCLAENEAESPWEPYSVSKGYGPGEDVVTAIPCEGPVQVWDDVSQDPDRLLVAIADMMSALGGGNIYRQADMVVAMSPQHAGICARAGLGRADAHRLLMERAGRRLGEIKRGGIWRGEAGARRWPFPVDLGDDDFFVPAVGDPADLHLIVAGGSGTPATLVMYGINVACRAVSRTFEA
jgi:hypothetical protein